MFVYTIYLLSGLKQRDGERHQKRTSKKMLLLIEIFSLFQAVSFFELSNFQNENRVCIFFVVSCDTMKDTMKDSEKKDAQNNVLNQAISNYVLNHKRRVNLPYLICFFFLGYFHQMGYYASANLFYLERFVIHIF